MIKKYVVLGEHIQLRDVGEFITDNKVLMLKSNMGIWLTPEAFDEKVNNDSYSWRECIVNPIILRNGHVASIPKGSYIFTFIEEIQG